MLQALPNTAALSSILWWDIQPNMSDPNDFSPARLYIIPAVGTNPVSSDSVTTSPEKYFQPTRESLPTPTVARPLSQKLSERLMGKAPLRLVAERVPIFITSATRPAYWVETLDCGHTVEAYQHFEDGNSVSPIPFAKRRRCLHCKEQLSDIKPVLPLPPGKLLHVGKFSQRVINRLHEAKFKEINPWIKDDLHVSAMAVHYAAQGYGKPWEWAFLHYYGKHDFKLIPYWLEQDAKRALLGPGLSNESLILPPKKPSVSVKPAKKEDVA